MNHAQVVEELHRASRAVLLGLLATAAMILAMVLGAALGAPGGLEPFPVQLMGHLLPALAPLPLAVITTIILFAYGAAAAALFSFLARPMSVGRGLAFGGALWVVMQTMMVPGILGGMEFGFNEGHALATVYTLILHLAYGGTLGWLGGRDETLHHVSFDELTHLRIG